MIAPEPGWILFFWLEHINKSEMTGVSSSKSDEEILNELKNGSVNDGDLLDKEGWRRICQVRGRNLSEVDADVWSEICRRRGSLFAR